MNNAILKRFSVYSGIKARTFMRDSFFSLCGGNECLRCGSKKGLLCKQCENSFTNDFSKISALRCSVCGKELISESETCLSCRENPILKSIEKAFPIYPYRMWNKKLLLDWKIKGERSLSPIFAKTVHNALKSTGFPSVIVPIPPRPLKIFLNGWDQVQELAYFLNTLYGYKVLKLLKRNSREQQKKKNREGRLLTTEGSYSLSKNALEFAKKNKVPNSVVLLDDIMTTGATIECCARLLKRLGIRKVYALSLFIVD